MDVTAEDSKAGPGQIPDVDQAAVKAAEPVSGVMGVAQRQFGAGWAVQDPWHAVRAGVAPVKPHKAQVGAATPCLLMLRISMQSPRHVGDQIQGGEQQVAGCRRGLLGSLPESATERVHKVPDRNNWYLQEKPWEALKAAETKNGRLALSQFRRLKQLGTGDVGLVDMVELQDGSGR